MSIDACKCHTISIHDSKRCVPLNPCYLVKKLVDLLEDPISADLYERQFVFLNEFLEASRHGFLIHNIAHLIRLLELFSERLKIFCVYKEPIKSLLLLSAIPPIFTKTSDCFQYGRDLQEYFSFLGFFLLRANEEELQDLTAQAICKLLSKRKTCMPLCYVSQKNCNVAVELSELPNVIAQLLEFVEEDLYVKLLKIASALVKISPKVCTNMIEKKAITFLLIRLDPDWRTRNFLLKIHGHDEIGPIQNFNIVGEILWELLNSLKNTDTQFHQDVIPNRHALWSLQYSLRSLTKDKYNAINRNQLLGIVILCLHVFPKMPLRQSGVVNDIVILSAATEMGTGSTWAAQINFAKTEVNYEFKKMLLLCLCYCSTIPDVIALLQPKRIIPALLKIITPELCNIWHPHQHSRLISLTLHTIEALLPKFITDFIYYEAPLRLLMMIDYYNSDSYDLHILQDCLKCSKALVENGDKRIHNIIVFNEGLMILNSKTKIINYCRGSQPQKKILFRFKDKVKEPCDVISVCDDLRKTGIKCIAYTRANSQYSNSVCDSLLLAEKLTLLSQKCLSYAFVIMEKLYLSEHTSESNSVSLCMTLLDRIITPNKNDPIFDPRFLICGIDFLWEAMVWTERNLKMFVSMGGVFKLLDVIQQSVFPVKLVALGALVDMCDEGSCVPHLITWRGNGMTLLPMLLELFREENRKIGVKTSLSGAINNIEAPIMGQQQWFETFFEHKDPNSSPATIDLLGSCRPKIYAIIQLLTNRHKLRVAISNEHYCMFSTDDLSINDQMTLLLAENFLALKLGETWVELSLDLNSTGIRPLAVDQEVISILTRRFYKWSFHLQKVQQRILNHELENEILKEKRLYNILKESKLIESLEALRDLDYIARTTEKMFRYLTKMKHVKNIECSRNFSPTTAEHTTYMHKLKVTPVFNQQVSVKSNVIDNPNEDEFDIRPVSTDAEFLPNFEN